LKLFHPNIKLVKVAFTIKIKAINIYFFGAITSEINSIAMERSPEIFNLMERTTEALSCSSIDSEIGSRETYQCLFATRLILETFKKEIAILDNHAIRDKAEQALSRLAQTLWPLTSKWSDVHRIINQIEQIKNSIRN